MPSIIAELLSHDLFRLLARVVLTAFFWIAGVVTTMKFPMMVNTVRSHGLPFPRAVVVAMIVTELGGSALLITDYRSLGWLGAGWLGVFTALSIPLGHPYWRFTGPKRMEEFQVALEHVTVIGGLMCAAALLVV